MQHPYKRRICLNCRSWAKDGLRTACNSTEMRRYEYFQPVKEHSCLHWKQADAKVLEKRYDKEVKK